MPDPTARMTRKPRVSILAILSILAAIAVAAAGVFFFTVQSKQWIGFVGMMLLAVAFAVFGVVELGAHGRDKALWRAYQDDFDEVTRRSDEESVDKAEAWDEPKYQGGAPEPDPEPVEEQPTRHVYTPLDVLEAKKIARETTDETPSTRDTMPGSGKKSMPPVSSSGSLPTPGMVTIPSVKEDVASEDSAADGAGLDLSALSGEDKGEDKAEVEDKAEESAEVEDKAEDTAPDTDEDKAEDKVEDSSEVEEKAEDKAEVDDTAEDELTDTTEDTAPATGEDITPATPAEGEDTTEVEDTTEDTTPATTPATTEEVTEAKSSVVDTKSGSSFNLLGFGKQDKE